jgi:aspartate racemase
MVGGIGPESTIDYYRLLLAGAKERGLGAPPPIFIHSLDVQYLLSLAGQDDKAPLAEYLGRSVSALARAGAQVGFFASNTPHVVFEQVAAQAPIPLVSIVAATLDAAIAGGFRRPGLIGTRFTMEGGFYQEAFSRRGLEIVLPDKEDRDLVHTRYVTELVPGKFSPDTRQEIVRVIERLRDPGGADCVILGGTELPLLLRGVEAPLPLLDTTRIHVAAILSRATLPRTQEPPLPRATP